MSDGFLVYDVFTVWYIFPGDVRLFMTMASNFMAGFLGVFGILFVRTSANIIWAYGFDGKTLEASIAGRTGLNGGGN